MRKLLAFVVLMALPMAAQDVKAIFLKHLKTSRDFSVKVAEAMPESDYGFKLTPPQMSFGEQIVHLSQGLGFFLGPMTHEKAGSEKPKSMSKADVIAFEKARFDLALEQVSALTTEQIHQTYDGGELGKVTGLELLMGMLDHTTHHRASAEMYLRAKGIKPPEYEF